MYPVLTVDALGRKACAELYRLTTRQLRIEIWDGHVQMCVLTRQKMYE